MSEPLLDPNTSAQPDELKDEVGLALSDASDPLIEAFKKDVDRTLLRENLKLTPAERARKFMDFARFAHELREAGDRARAKDPSWGLK